MILPKLDVRENNKVLLKVFGGLDRRSKISDTSLTDMTNMSCDAAPALTVRDGRKKIADIENASEICPPEYSDGDLTSFTGVAGGRFFYNGTQISGSLTSGRKSIANFNGKICIFPDKKYYCYLPDPTTGSIDDSLKSMEKTVSITSAKFYSSYDEVTGAYSAYIEASGGFDSVFTVGDSVIIDGCQTLHNNTKRIQSKRDFAADDDIVSVVIDKVSSGRIDLLLYNKKGGRETFSNCTENGTVTVKSAIPDMDNICVHNNRLWGTAVSGEYVYASKLGDCTNFNSFQGLGDDSWYSYVATGGGFTGICSYRTAVVAFKRGYIHHIYGDSPVNFSIPKQTFGGCIDGRSICEIGGVLYYLAHDGFRAYSGGEPYDISPQLKFNYVSCAAGTDGRHYYAAAKRNDGTCDVLVYSPDYDIWVREDDTPFCGFCTFNGSIYGIADGHMWKIGGGDEPFKWRFVSKRFTYDSIDYKGLSCIWLRLDLKNEAKADVSVSYDGGDFVPCGKICGGKGFSVSRIPVRFKQCDSFRIMLSGEGGAVIHDIEITSHNGGRIYG